MESARWHWAQGHRGFLPGGWPLPCGSGHADADTCQESLRLWPETSKRPLPEWPWLRSWWGSFWILWEWEWKDQCPENRKGLCCEGQVISSPPPSAGVQAKPFNGQDSVTIAFKFLPLFLLRNTGFEGPGISFVVFCKKPQWGAVAAGSHD